MVNDAESLAKAKFILKAVNSHAALVAALRDVLSIVELQPTPKLGEWNWPAIANDIRAALAAAEKE